MRRSPKVAEVLPLLYLHGLSSGDFAPALREFLGAEAGLSPTTIVRLTEKWQKEREEFMDRDLSERDYVYVWVDGIHTTKVRLGQDDKLCCLVMIGARVDGKKELVALQDGYRESCESWATLLRDLKKRGMRAPVLAVGDEALGFWRAVRGIFPETRHQRDWVHKFASEFGIKWPKAVAKITDDEEALLCYYDYPAELWRQLKTTNPIESPFATVRARTDITKGAGSREAGVAMIFKLLEAAEGRWRRLNGYWLVPLVRAGARFVNGELVERNEEKVAA